MSTYSVREVERILSLSRSAVRSLIKVGFVAPSRGRRREYCFSFQDLIALRMARSLIDAKIPRKRIHQSLEELRKQLPQTAPLSGLNIRAVGDRVVVRDGADQWQADDGQYVLAFDVVVEEGTGILRVMRQERSESAATRSTESHDWFAEALQAERSDPDAAIKAYERAVNQEADHLSAWINWGRLLHERGELKEAEDVYRRAQAQCGPNALLMFNMGVLLEDLERVADAAEAYKLAVEDDPTLADAHYNLARVFESLGSMQHAIRHFARYRRLTNSLER